MKHRCNREDDTVPAAATLTSIVKFKNKSKPIPNKLNSIKQQLSKDSVPYVVREQRDNAVLFDNFDREEEEKQLYLVNFKKELDHCAHKLSNHMRTLENHASQLNIRTLEPSDIARAGTGVDGDVSDSESVKSANAIDAENEAAVSFQSNCIQQQLSEVVNSFFLSSLSLSLSSCFSVFLSLMMVLMVG